MASSRSSISIIGPSVADANNGNGRTSSRWQRFLARRFVVTTDVMWPPSTDGSARTAAPGDGSSDADDDADDVAAVDGVGDEGRKRARSTPASTAAPDLLIALHAGRSSASLARFVAAYPDRPTIVVLTGTDLYRDLDSDPSVRRSLAAATRIVVLQPEAVEALPPSLRDKVDVIVQSAPTLARRSPDPRAFELVMVGHLRDEKDPATAWRALDRVTRHDRSVRLIHIGAALDERLDTEAGAFAGRNPNYRWLGALSHALTRQQIRRARALVMPSRVEGGAHAVIEAVTSGVPVLASEIPGNVGLLGRRYAGYFPVGDDLALAALIERAHREPAFVSMLTAQCAEQAPRFRPEQERQRLITLAASLLPADRPVPTAKVRRPRRNERTDAARPMKTAR